MAISDAWRKLGFTSGRRTYRGNKLVGGVNNSRHLSGTAADFTADEATLRRQFPGKPILNEGDHRHVSGLENVPYYGNKGIAGLVNGVDTSAPKGSQMHPRRRPTSPQQGSYYPDDPITRSLGGMDPLAPLPEQVPQMGGQMMAQQQQPQMGMMEQQPMNPDAVTPRIPGNLPGHDPLAPKPSTFGKGGVGWSVLGILGDALSAYGGQKGSFAPAMRAKAEGEREENMFQRRLEAERQMKMEAMQAKMNEPQRFENNSGDQLERDPRTGEVRVLYADTSPKPNWMKVENSDGSVTMQPGPGGNRPSDGHVSALRQNPDRAAEFDAKFGRGMAQYYLGGR